MIKYLVIAIIFMSQLTYAADREQQLNAIAQGLTAEDFDYLEDVLSGDLFIPDEVLAQMFGPIHNDNPDDYIAIPDEIIIEEDGYGFRSLIYFLVKRFLARMPARQD